MLSLAYQAIKQRLNASIPEVAGRIHWYNALLTDDHAEPVFETPTLFIEFGEIHLHEIKGFKNTQGGRLSFSIHCIEQYNYNDDAVLNALAIADKVSAALHKRDFKLSELPAYASLKDTNKDWMLLSTIVRTSITADHRHVNLVDTVVRFGAEGVQGETLL